MRSAGAAQEAASRWDIATPPDPGLLLGVQMAGFGDRSSDPLDLGVVPFPAVTVAVDLGEDLRMVDDAGRQERGSLVFGLGSRSVRASGSSVECLQIRLSPVVAHAVLDASSELDGTVVGLEAIWGREAGRIEDRLRAARSWEERFQIAGAAIARRLESGRRVDPEVAFAWEQLAEGGGQVRIDQLAAELGWSRKRLWSRFRAQVGLTPKRAAQLIRFDRAAHRLAAGQSPADVAAESGYADQSHLHRETVAFSGMSPTALAAAPWLAVDDVAWAERPSPTTR